MSKLLLPEKTDQLSPQQKGWLTLSQMKDDCVSDLTKAELEIQGLVKDWENMDLEKIQEALKGAKSKTEDLKARRLNFTGMIQEKLISKMMDFEKRSFELLTKVQAKELELRKEASKKQEEINKKNAEISKLKAHITNEFLRIGKVYRQALENIVLRIYSQALQEKIAPGSIEAFISENMNLFLEVKSETPNKFQRELVSVEEAKEIAKEIDPVNFKNIFDSVLKKMKSETFAMYEQDLKNAEAAIEAAEQQHEEQIAAEEEEFTMETSTNNLMGAAVPFELVGQTGPKTSVKTSYLIKREDTEAFAMKVLATFIKNWPEAKTKIGTKSWIKLVDPFTKALDKLGKQFDGLQYEEQCK